MRPILSVASLCDRVCLQSKRRNFIISMKLLRAIVGEIIGIPHNLFHNLCTLILVAL